MINRTNFVLNIVTKRLIVYGAIYSICRKFRADLAPGRSGSVPLLRRCYRPRLLYARVLRMRRNYEVFVWLLHLPRSPVCLDKTNALRLYRGIYLTPRKSNGLWCRQVLRSSYCWTRASSKFFLLSGEESPPPSPILEIFRDRGDSRLCVLGQSVYSEHLQHPASSVQRDIATAWT